MEFTGEFYVPALPGDIRLEHIHRYLIAQQLVVGMDVLDIASGEGYGTALLGQVARSVVGVDIAAEQVAHGEATYGRPNVSFRIGTCDSIPLEDHTVDAVISFETIEHHDKHAEMLDEIRRVLKPGGFFLVSTPDHQRYSVDPGYSNPFHVKELFFTEFRDLIAGHFANFAMYGQRVAYGSVVLAEVSGGRPSCFWESPDNPGDFSSGDLRPLYWLALASDADLPDLPVGLFEHPIMSADAVQAQLAEQAGVAAALRTDVEARAEELTRATIELASTRADLSAARSELSAQRSLAAKAQAAFAGWQETRRALARATERGALLETSNRSLKIARTYAAHKLAETERDRDRLAAEVEQIRQSRLLLWRDAVRANGLSLRKVARVGLRSLALVAPSAAAAVGSRARHGTSRLSRRNLPATRIAPSPARGAKDQVDAEFYLAAYPDIEEHGWDPVQHYSDHGKREARLPRPPIDIPAGWNRSGDAVLIVCHEASRSGAPILALNVAQQFLQSRDVAVYFDRSGPMTEWAEQMGVLVVDPESWGPVSSPDKVFRLMVHRLNPRIVFVNSVMGWRFSRILAELGVPAVTLIHEFPAVVKPASALYEAALWSSETVFSAKLVLNAAQAAHLVPEDVIFPVVPQGRCVRPDASYDSDGAIQSPDHQAEARSNGLVIGIGRVEARKGPDLFIQCARALLQAMTPGSVRFGWFGRYEPETNAVYDAMIGEDISRSGLDPVLTMAGEVEDIDGVYASARLLLLTSRVDPLPNSAIDAMAAGVPVVCFDGATGIADHLRSAGLADACVVPYLDVDAMAVKAKMLLTDELLYEAVSARVKALAAETFDMTAYCQELLRIGDRAVHLGQQEAADYALLSGAHVLLNEYMLPNWMSDPARFYLRTWRTDMVPTRKPFPGFHPGIYRAAHPGLEADPLADFLRQNMPVGPWLSSVIDTESAVGAEVPSSALHIHAYYVEMLGEILRRLRRAQVRPDLFVTVASTADAEVARRELDREEFVGEVVVVPNKGRDIGPFVTEILPAISARYQIIGHVHTKKTTDVPDRPFVDEWRRFLLDNLIGGRVAMAGRILHALATSPSLGLVFPDDPFAMRWGHGNRSHAEALVRRLGDIDLPAAIDFPVGTMFWAKSSALASVSRLNLEWADYPPEPVGIDGTILHALERLLPTLAAADGFGYAVTHVDGVTRGWSGSNRC